MIYAAKLRQFNLDGIDFERKTRLIGAHVLKKEDSSVGVKRNYLSEKDTNRIKSILPVSILEACIGITKSLISDLPPHVHTQELCVINFYKKTQKQKTVFYDGVVEKDDTLFSDVGNSYIPLDKNLLSVVEYFVAEDNDVWVLNTRQPHAVVCDSPEEKREVIQVFLNIPYLTAIETLNKNDTVNRDI
jgi:hypothetical protein